MQRAVNPQTGEVLFLVNNQWVPPSSTAKNPETGQTAYLVNNEWQIVDPIKKPEEPGFLERVTGITPSQVDKAAVQLAEAAVPEFDLVKRGVALQFKVLRVLRLVLKLRYGVLVAGLPQAKQLKILSCINSASVCLDRSLPKRISRQQKSAKLM
jgi:hypothetical protein